MPNELSDTGGDGTNPEQLFAAAYAACFESALRLVARMQTKPLRERSSITARVTIGKTGHAAFDLAVELLGRLVGLSPSEGSALMEAAAPGMSLLARHGEVVLRVRRIGYLMAFRALSVDSAAVDQTLHIALERAPIALGEVVVQAERLERRLRRAGFFERARGGFGHFITEEHIRVRNPPLVSDVLRGVPGLTVAPSARRVGANLVYVARAQGRLTGRVCLPKVFVDGVITGQHFDDFLTPDEIAGIEIYRGPAETPAQFGGAESDCGVIVVWTK